MRVLGYRFQKENNMKILVYDHFLMLSEITNQRELKNELR